MPRELERDVWPTEDFEAALSFVPIARGEDDLFAGLESPAAADAMARRTDLDPETAAYDGRVTHPAPSREAS